MPGLTAPQILIGAKGYARTVPAPPPEPPGRWRCTLCPWPRWIDGTYDDWQHHYQTHHQED
jgi:hypothetical protein